MRGSVRPVRDSPRASGSGASIAALDDIYDLGRQSGPTRDLAQRDRGSISIVLCTLAAVVTVAVVAGLITLSGAAVGIERAQTAADAAALAAVTFGRDGAVRAAATNGAEIESIEFGSDWVEVAVVIDGVRATARATDSID